jgi:hypothetical protein
MRYHDFHFREYRVADFGKRITLDLVFDYAGKPREESQIEFSDVALYNFTHTGGAIITDIEEASSGDLLGEVVLPISPDHTLRPPHIALERAREEKVPSSRGGERAAHILRQAA